MFNYNSIIINYKEGDAGKNADLGGGGELLTVGGGSVGVLLCGRKKVERIGGRT